MVMVLIVAGLIILLLATFKYPPLSLAFFLMTPFFKASLMLKFPFFRKVDYTVLCAVLTLIAMGYSFLKRKGQLKGIVNFPLLMYLFLAVLLLFGVTYTTAPHYGLVKSSRFATLGLVAFLAPVVFANSMKEIKLMIWIVIIGGVVLAVGTLIEPHASVLRESAPERATFLESDPLSTAAAMGAATIACSLFATMVHTSRRLKIVSVAAIPLLLGVMITTGSRGPFIGILLTWLVAIFICYKQMSKVWFPLFVIAGAIALSMLFVKLPEISTERIARIWRSGYELKSASQSRMEMFIWAASRFIEQPVLGHGTGAFAVDRGGIDERKYPHNIILELLYEQGVVGAAVLCAFLWLIFRRWRQAANLVKSYLLTPEIYGAVHLAGLLFLFTFTQAMKSGDVDGNRIMFFYAGLVIAAFNVTQRMAEEISLENELAVEGQRYSEGLEFHGTEILY